MSAEYCLRPRRAPNTAAEVMGQTPRASGHIRMQCFWNICILAVGDQEIAIQKCMGYILIVEQANRPSRNDPRCSHTVNARPTCFVSGINRWLHPSPFENLCPECVSFIQWTAAINSTTTFNSSFFMSTMKALLLSQPHVLSISEIPKPRPGPGEVLLKIEAAGITPSDLLNVSGGFPYTTYPRVPGRDFAATVIDGPPHTIGQEVFGTSGRSLGFTRDGPYAELCVVPEDAVARKPSNISFAQAATIGVSFTTASITLRRGQVSPGDVVMILGATGSVGSAATQLAISRGCKVITASRKSTTDINLVNDPSLSKALELTNGKGVDVVVDTTGDPAVMNAAIDVLAHGGRLVFIAAPRSGSTDFTFDLKRLYRQEQMIIGCNSLSYSPAEMATELQALQPLFENGQLSVMNEEELTIINLNDAHDTFTALRSHSRSKYIIRFP